MVPGCVTSDHGKEPAIAVYEGSFPAPRLSGRERPTGRMEVPDSHTVFRRIPWRLPNAIDRAPGLCVVHFVTCPGCRAGAEL